MGRPRKVLYRDGEITLKGLSKEDSDLIETIIYKAAPRVKPWEEQLEKEKCNEISYGLVKIDGVFKLVTLKFELDHEWCYIEKVEDIGNDYSIATGKCRVLIGQNMFDKHRKI